MNESNVTFVDFTRETEQPELDKFHFVKIVDRLNTFSRNFLLDIQSHSVVTCSDKSIRIANEITHKLEELKKETKLNITKVKLRNYGEQL